MRESWRIGIDEEVKTELVRRGVFRLSRNPIFLGMRIMLIGFFLALPNAVTLAMLLVGDALMQIQVRLEEEHLARMHGENYREYQRKTRRWL
jgi:protein-S-isoprenylcysteine O-methyltransferase Ste14